MFVLYNCSTKEGGCVSVGLFSVKDSAQLEINGKTLTVTLPDLDLSRFSDLDDLRACYAALNNIWVAVLPLYGSGVRAVPQVAVNQHTEPLLGEYESWPALAGCEHFNHKLTFSHVSNVATQE